MGVFKNLTTRAQKSAALRLFAGGAALFLFTAPACASTLFVLQGPVLVVK